MCIEEMEEGKGASNHDKEAKGQNTRVGNATIDSNVRKDKGEHETLIDMVRSLKMEVHSYKEENERLMRKKSQMNAQVLQSLNQLQRQMKKGSNSGQEGGGRCYERGYACGRDGYSRSASKDHGHHSPHYSERNFYALDDPISSPEVSPIRQQ
jgi:FtsZ-binding cell division protein ZapB